jgi:hypothetical protein
MLLQSTPLANQDISAYLLADSYTADADREMTIFVALDQVAGGGDYSVYLTRQLAGAGAAYMLGPITTFAAPAAQTAIAFQSLTVAAEVDDVIAVYVKGLPADTATVDIITRWYDVAAALWATEIPGTYAEGQAGYTVGRALPNATPGNEGGLPVLDANFNAAADVKRWSGATLANAGTNLIGFQDADGNTTPLYNSVLPTGASGTNNFSVVSFAVPDNYFKDQTFFCAGWVTVVTGWDLATTTLTLRDNVPADFDEQGFFILPFLVSSATR